MATMMIATSGCVGSDSAAQPLAIEAHDGLFSNVTQLHWATDEALGSFAMTVTLDAGEYGAQCDITWAVEGYSSEPGNEAMAWRDGLIWPFGGTDHHIRTPIFATSQIQTDDGAFGWGFGFSGHLYDEVNFTLAARDVQPTPVTAVADGSLAFSLVCRHPVMIMAVRSGQDAVLADHTNFVGTGVVINGALNAVRGSFDAIVERGPVELHFQTGLFGGGEQMGSFTIEAPEEWYELDLATQPEGRLDSAPGRFHMELDMQAVGDSSFWIVLHSTPDEFDLCPGLRDTTAYAAFRFGSPPESSGPPLHC